MTTEEIFAAQAADVLVKGLAARIDEIPEEGPFTDVYSSVDADELYGAGWAFVLVVKWNKYLEKHCLELAAYEIPNPYKSCRMLASGTKETIVCKLQEPDLHDKIADAIPSLYRNLRDV